MCILIRHYAVAFWIEIYKNNETGFDFFFNLNFMCSTFQITKAIILPVELSSMIRYTFLQCYKLVVLYFMVLSVL